MGTEERGSEHERLHRQRELERERLHPKPSRRQGDGDEADIIETEIVVKGDEEVQEQSEK